MRNTFTVWACLLCAVWLAACAGIAPLPPADDGPRSHTVTVMSNGWHTAIIIPRADLEATTRLVASSLANSVDTA